MTLVLTVPAPAVLAQPDTELREPSHSSEEQVSGSDTVLGTHRNKDQREVLQQLLDDGHMIYRVRSDGRGLERRVSPVAEAQAITAADAAEQAGFPVAGERLIAAWNSIYALKPDPSGAYRDAIRAVEAVANPFFLSGAPAPTLGQVIRHLEDHSSDYEMVIAGKTSKPADVSAALRMMRLLWEGPGPRQSQH